MIKQKILHILYSGLGGTTDYVFNLIKADVGHEFEHHILFYGVEKVPLPQLNLANTIADSVTYIPKQKGYDKQAFKAVLLYLKNEKPSVIVLHVNSLILTCAKYKASKLIFVEHQANHLKTKKEWLWSLIAQKKSDRIISFTTLYQKELSQALKLFYNKDKSTIINTGIDLSVYKPINKPVNTIIKIGIISRINSFRDHETLLKAFLELNSTAELFIAGNGPLKQTLELKYKSKNITWLGLLDAKQIKELLKSLDIYVIASFGESTSIALMQAQASGLPIIATNVNGINNVLTSTNCVFVTLNSVSEYKNALQLLINDTAKRQTLAKNSLAYATVNLSHFSMFERYKKLFKL